MRIIVLCYPTYGGSGVVAAETSIRLAERGHQIHVISHAVPIRIDRWVPGLITHTVEAARYPLFHYPPYTLNLVNKIVRIVLEHDIQIIHSHYAIPYASVAYLAKQVLECEHNHKLELACTLHGTDITLVGKEPSFYDLTRFAIKQQQFISVPSAWLRNETSRDFNVPEDRMEVIPNFIDLDRFRPGDGMCRKELAPEGYAILTHMSNFRPVKQVPDLVRSFAVFRKKKKAVLVLVGDGPELSAAEELARELGIREDLRIMGKMDKVEVVLQASDLFFLPSISESFGVAALEALACGCPVIGYETGGLPEVVENGVSGLLCPVGKGTCMGGLAAELLDDQERYQAMRVAARQRAEKFNEEHVIDQYEAGLKGLLNAE